MDRDSYRKLRANPRLRDAFESVVSQQPPTRTALADALAEAGMPDTMVDEHIDELAKLAQQVRLGTKRWHALQEAHDLAVKALDRIDAEDSLLGELHALADDDYDGEQDVRTALARQRQGIAGGNPSLRQTSPGPATWQQGR